jgi:putative transposase
VNHTQIYVHFVWTTWKRLPLVTEQIEGPMYAAILQKCRDLKCHPLAIGGIPDHVHLLVGLHPTISVSSLIGSVKGVSSHLVTHRLQSDTAFKWQNGYAAFTLRHSDLADLKGYIHGQKQHHAHNQLIPDYELTAPD